MRVQYKCECGKRYHTVIDYWIAYNQKSKEEYGVVVFRCDKCDVKHYGQMSLPELKEILAQECR